MTCPACSDMAQMGPPIIPKAQEYINSLSTINYNQNIYHIMVILTPRMVEHIIGIILILTAVKNYTSNFADSLLCNCAWFLILKSMLQPKHLSHKPQDYHEVPLLSDTAGHISHPCLQLIFKQQEARVPCYQLYPQVNHICMAGPHLVTPPTVTNTSSILMVLLTYYILHIMWSDLNQT